jgi:hypothetical protein
MFLTLEATVKNDADARADLHALLSSGRLSFSEPLPQLANPSVNVTQPTTPIEKQHKQQEHSTLYYLYSLGKTPRLPGFDSFSVLKDALQILAHPHDLEQNNSDLDTTHTHLLEQLFRAEVRNKHHASLEPNNRTAASFHVDSTYNCAMATLMGRMASLHPCVLASQLNQLSSRAGSMLVASRADFISPEDPKGAEALLKRGNFKYYTQGEHFFIELPAPAAGILRSHNTLKHQQQQGHLDPRTASPLSTLYQTTLLYNAASKGYDVATDKRDTFDYCQYAISIASSLNDAQKQELLTLMSNIPQPDRLRKLVGHQLGTYTNASLEDRLAILGNLYGENSGLVEDQTIMMERLLAIDHTYTTFPMQLTSKKNNPTQAEANSLYLTGYTRSFEQLEQDIIQALDTGDEVMIAQAPVTAEGEVLSAHVVKINGYEYTPDTHELMFVLTDTQDEQKGQRKEASTQLMPQINSISLPHTQASRLWLEQMAQPFVRLLPDEGDRKKYRVPTVRDDFEPNPSDNPALSKLRSLYSLGKAPLLWQALMQPWLEQASEKTTEKIPSASETASS